MHGYQQPIQAPKCVVLITVFSTYHQVVWCKLWCNGAYTVFLLVLTDKETFNSIDTNRYPMKEVLLHELVKQPQAPAVSTVKALLTRGGLSRDLKWTGVGVG